MTLHLLRRILTVGALAAAFALLVPANPAEAKLAFYRNYPDLKWKVIKTEHFNVFYPVSRDFESDHYIDADFTARKTAYIAEEMYPLICGQFNYYLDETVNIVMLDQTDSLTGYTVPNFDWIVVSARHSDMLWRLRGHHDWLRNVMYHEFAHVVSLKADQVFAEESFGAVLQARWNDGRINTNAEASAFIGTGDPWFWVEGGAEYYTEVAGINTWTANRDMRMRMDILDGMELNFADMGDYYGSNGGFDGNRHYLAGYSFALYLEERFGEGVYQSFATKRDEKGWTPDWLSVIEDTLNVSADELFEDWKAWGKVKYEKVRDEVMEDPAIGTEVLLKPHYWESDAPSDIERTEWVRTFKAGNKHKWRNDREKPGLLGRLPRMSSDGSRWGHVPNWGGGIQLSRIPFDRYPAFNDDAEYMVVRDKIEKLEASLQVTHSVPYHFSNGQFDFSPDGKKLVMSCPEDLPKSRAEWKSLLFTELAMNLDGYSWHTLCVMDLETQEQLARDEMVDFFGYDPQAEDEERLEKMRRGVEVEEQKKAKGKKAKRRWWQWADKLFPGDYLESYPAFRRIQDPAWSPDGRHIAFSTYDDGTQNLWVMDLETREGRALTQYEDGTRIESIDWSPDGEQLVFGSYRWNQADIYVINLDGTGGRALTFDRFEDREPHWAHDGNIYFTSDRVGKIFNVFRLNPNRKPGQLDRDLDGIVDADDQCPDRPETRNLYRDYDGCPDGIPVRVEKERIEISETIFFEFDQAIIKEESYDLVKALARTILEHPEIKALEIAGHTDSKGTRKYNLELSQRRAEAVRDFLSAEGVDASLLTAVGYGNKEPLNYDKSEEANAANRRVEFLITARDAVEEIVEMGPDGEEGQAAVQVAQAAPEFTDDQLDNAYLVQVTNVVSGAFGAWLAPNGDLLYSRYSAFGFRNFGLSSDEFHNKVVDDTLLVIADADAPMDVLQEEYPDYEAVTSDVPFHAAYPRNAALIPFVDIGNVSLTHIGVNLGMLFMISDALDTNSFTAMAFAGEDLMLWGRYENKALWPEFYLGGMLRTIKYDYGFRLDEDGSNETLDDQFLGDLKQAQHVAGGFAGISLPFSPIFNMELSTFQYGLSSQGVTDGKNSRPIVYRGNQSLSVNLVIPSISASRASRLNTRVPVSAFSFSWSPNFAIQLNPSTAGVAVDDGQIFDRYYFNEFGFVWTQYFHLPVKNKIGGNAGHRLMSEMQFGIIDRNVPYSDEIHGGGSGGVNVRNPYSSSTTFSGYEPYSLAGETALILNLQYSLPIIRQIDRKVGPVYFESLHLVLFGTVGNLWSYQVEGEQSFLFGDRVLTDEANRKGGQNPPTEVGLKREWPGTRAEENGQYVLADAGIELQLNANMFNRSRWKSFFRVSYGFMPVAGRGDVDGDDVYTNSADPTISSRSDETEPAGFRFYLGIGTGF